MSIEPNALSAQGSRRLNLTMLSIRDQADQFEGVARGSAKPLRFLAAFQEAEPYLGLPPQAFKLVAWLVKMTQPQDWESGSRPIAWPSALRQQEFLGLTPSAVKNLNRALFDAGIFVLRDSPTGKRYGRRDDTGRIIEAYGFDLSPLAFRSDEFIRLAAEARAERERIQALKRRATCARRAIAQIGETLATVGPLPVDWPQLASETSELVKAIRRTRTSAELALIVNGLESRKIQAEAWAKEASKPVETGPVGPTDKPHIITTNLSFNPSDTVIAAEESSRVEVAPQSPQPVVESKAEAHKAMAAPTPELSAKILPAELLQLAPCLADYVARPCPDWADIVTAAGNGLRHDLGVSPSLWGEACLAVGRVMAAIILAVVSTKPREHFTRGAGGYFAAMIQRAKKGELHLDRSVWKLRRDRLDRIEREGQGRSSAAWRGIDAECSQKRPIRSHGTASRFARPSPDQS
jgi:replication initiation protein RepC